MRGELVTEGERGCRADGDALVPGDSAEPGERGPADAGCGIMSGGARGPFAGRLAPSCCALDIACGAAPAPAGGGGLAAAASAASSLSLEVMRLRCSGGRWCADGLAGDGGLGGCGELPADCSLSDAPVPAPPELPPSSSSVIDLRSSIANPIFDPAPAPASPSGIGPSEMSLLSRFSAPESSNLPSRKVRFPASAMSENTLSELGTGGGTFAKRACGGPVLLAFMRVAGACCWKRCRRSDAASGAVSGGPVSDQRSGCPASCPILPPAVPVRAPGSGLRDLPCGLRARDVPSKGDLARALCRIPFEVPGGAFGS